VTSRPAWPSAVILAATVLAGVSAAAPWVRALGAPVPTSADISQRQVDRAGMAEKLTGNGVTGGGGALILAVICLLVVLVLWRVSPRFRPAVAGNLTIAASIAAAGTVFWFLVDDGRRLDALGNASVDTDTLSMTPWPWVTLGCFALSCLAGVLTIPAGDTGRRCRPNGRRSPC